MRRTITPFGKAVKKALIDNDMTQEQLAQEVGTSTKYLNLVFIGERPGTRFLPAIVSTLGLGGEWLDDQSA